MIDETVTAIIRGQVLQQAEMLELRSDWAGESMASSLVYITPHEARIIATALRAYANSPIGE